MPPNCWKNCWELVKGALHKFIVLVKAQKTGFIPTRRPFCIQNIGNGDPPLVRIWGHESWCVYALHCILCRFRATDKYNINESKNQQQFVKIFLLIQLFLFILDSIFELSSSCFKQCIWKSFSIHSINSVQLASIAYGKKNLSLFQFTSIGFSAGRKTFSIQWHLVASCWAG